MVKDTISKVLKIANTATDEAVSAPSRIGSLF